MADSTAGSVSDSLRRIPENISVSFLPKGETLSKRALQRGLNYFIQSYIHKIRVSEVSDDDVRVDARCYRSMKKNDQPHQLHVEIQLPRQKIVESFCSCKAGLDGHCSHIVGLLKTLQGLKLHNFTHVPEQQSCTSIPQQWHIPRGDKIQPVPLNHVVVARPLEKRSRPPVVCQFDTSYRLPEVKPEDLWHLKRLASTPLANLSVNAPNIDTVVGSVQIGSALSYQTRNIKQQKRNPDQLCGNICVNREAHIKLGEEFKSLNTLPDGCDTTKLEKDTRLQSKSSEWHHARSTRLTSSNFGKIVHRKAAPTPKFVASLFPVTEIHAVPLEYGKRNEGNAKQKYLSIYQDRHLHDCGFVVNTEFDFLGASPDGKVCDNGETGLIEIKCPYTARQSNIIEACAEIKDFFLSQEQGHIQLKKNHMYYSQVQGQLMITGCDFCDFIVYTKKDMYVQRILPDLEYMQDMLKKLARFYKDHALPYLNSIDAEN